MTTYVAMLRGVNVGGRNRLAMDQFQEIVGAAGGDDIQTYIQSGNAVFSSRRPPASLVSMIEEGLEARLHARVPVLLRSAGELTAVLRSNPFLRRGVDTDRLHVTFLGSKPGSAAVKSALSFPAGDDEFAVVGRDVYLFCTEGYGRTKLSNAFFEKRLSSAATTRNWKTVATLAGMAGS
jgi:uncharacterized protein (DUF1697 family)